MDDWLIVAIISAETNARKGGSGPCGANPRDHLGRVARKLRQGGDAVQLSVLLVLMLPVFLQGLGALHIRSRPLRGRPVMLVLLYALLILFSVPTALLVTALGLLEHWGRRAPALPPQS